MSGLLPTDPINKALNPSAEALGKSLGGIAKTILYPFLKWNAFISADLDKFEKQVTEKTENIPLENRDSSKVGLALKSIEESKYQLTSEEMRNRFSSLIASTVDKRKNSTITPRFATVLSQLSSNEAALLLKIGEMPNGVLPSAHLRLAQKDGSGSTVPPRYLGFSKLEVLTDDVAISTFFSLGLIEIFENSWLTADIFSSIYASMEKSSMFEIHSNQILKANSGAPGTVEFQKSYIQISAFGKAFISLVS